MFQMGTAGLRGGTLHVTATSHISLFNVAACSRGIGIGYRAGWFTWAEIVREERTVCRRCLAGIRELTLYGPGS